MDLEINDVRWFNSARGLVGIVRVEMDDERDESVPARRVIRYFIGPGTGTDQRIDAQSIADWGARFPQAAGLALFGR